MADETNRRDFLKAAAVTSLVAPHFGRASAEASPTNVTVSPQRSVEPSRQPGEVERWGVYEAAAHSLDEILRETVGMWESGLAQGTDFPYEQEAQDPVEIPERS